jgi:hypothetical protein
LKVRILSRTNKKQNSDMQTFLREGILCNDTYYIVPAAYDSIILPALRGAIVKDDRNLMSELRANRCISASYLRDVGALYSVKMYSYTCRVCSGGARDHTLLSGVSTEQMVSEAQEGAILFIL